MKRDLFLLAAAAFLVSCSPVPYDAGLTESARTVAKLTQDTPSPVSVDLFTDSIETIVGFYPRLTTTGFDYGTGFVVSENGAQTIVRAVSLDPSSGILRDYGFSSVSIPNQAPPMPSWVAWPTKDTPAFNAWLSIQTFDSLDPVANDTFAQFEVQAGSPPTFLFPGISSPSHLIQTQTGFSGLLMGASFDADTSGAQDNEFWLVRQTAGPGFVEFQSPASSAGIILSSLRSSGYPYALSFIPPGSTQVQYFYDENQAGDPARHPNASFALWQDGGHWVCYRWAEDPPNSGVYPFVQIPIDHRIDAMLSTGQLFSTEGGTGRLYDRDGALLATFALGNLQFLSEEYVGGQARMYFSQLLSYNQQVHFNVYWIPTASLATLGN